MPDLPTVTLEAVEILSTGGPVHGIGSPPKGDYWTTDDLKGMAASAQELEAAGELKAAAKIGHDPKQTLLASSVTAGEMPAAGWLTNQRVSDDGTKLLADIVDVPRKIADLIKAKAYRTRSVEMGKPTSQTTGKKHSWVVDGLAWLGGQMPAVRTLDDVVALYEGSGFERMFVQVDEVEAGSIDELRDFVAGLSENFLVPTVTPKPTRADIRPVPTETKPKFTDEQRRKFSEALAEHGVEVKPEDVTDEQLAKAGVETPSPEPTTPPTPDTPTPTGPEAEKQLEQIRKFEERANAADERVRKLEEKLRNKDRDVFVEQVLRDGKATPGQRDDIVAMYEESPEIAQKFFANAPVNDDWSREYGADSDEITDEQREAEEKSYEADAAARLGLETVL